MDRRASYLLVCDVAPVDADEDPASGFGIAGAGQPLTLAAMALLGAP